MRRSESGMDLRPGRAGAVVCAWLALAPPTLAAAAPCGGPFPFTAMSGGGAKQQHSRAKTRKGGAALTRDPAAHALHELAVEFVGTRACRITASFMPLPASTDLKEWASATLQLPGCGSGTHRTASVDSGEVVVGVQACTDAKTGQLQGLRLRGASLVDGKLGKPSDDPEALEDASIAPASCTADRWHDAATCPAGQLAIGLRAGHDGKGYTGLALECAPPDACAAR